jgi:DNA adenine methylase Dam
MINTPFNYTGSKMNLLPQLLPLFDYSKPLFIDLFTGGGSVYTNVVDKYSRILINDILKDLIGIHKQLINNPDEIIEEVKELATCKDDQEKYVKLRNSYNTNKTPEKLWALMLSCTNNMLRFNKNFDFNQSWGQRGWSDATQKKVDEFVKHISKYKNKIYFTSTDFFNVPIKSDGMYYADPPYNNSDDGHNRIWSDNLEVKLYNYLREVDKRGGSFALSGLYGEHNKNEKRSYSIDKLIEDGFSYTVLDYGYEKISRKKEVIKNSKEVLVYNYYKV